MGDELSVLLVGDDEDELALVAAYLRRHERERDWDVAAETDPEAALERVRSGERFDCVVSDTTVHGMDGVDFVETLRGHVPGIPALLFASDGPAAVASRVVEAGVTDYLQKGFGAEQYTMLARRVNHAVDGVGSFDPETDVELDRVSIIGTDDRFETVDDGYAALYGYTADEVVGRHWTDLHPASAVEHVRSHVLPLVSEGGQWSGLSEGLRADGSRFTESKLVQSLSDGRLLVAVSPVDPGSE